MEISLIRHGKSTWINNKRVTFQGFKDWIEMYDAHGVFENKKRYPAWTIEKVNRANVMVSSDLKRSIDSARILKPSFDGPSYPLFREIEFPHVPEIVEKVKLYPTVWALLLRSAWFIGYAKDAESYKEASKRAEKAADLLIDYAEKQESVVLVGHGFFNFLIARQLQKKGWKGRKNTSFDHWVANTYKA